jgi:hypothetical protein
MSAECHECGADITYPPGTWPIGSCERCDLNGRIDALIATGDVLATRLDETPAVEHHLLGPGDFYLDLDTVEKSEEKQQAVRAWLAIAHPNGEGHKP